MRDLHVPRPRSCDDVGQAVTIPVRDIRADVSGDDVIPVAALQKLCGCKLGFPGPGRRVPVQPDLTVAARDGDKVGLSVLVEVGERNVHAVVSELNLVAARPHLDA